MNKPVVIYIAGYGRSGSTLLERLLNSHPQIFGAGELIFLYSEYQNDNSICACGLNMEECSVWGGVFSCLSKGYTIDPDQRSKLAHLDTLRMLPELLFQIAGSKKKIYRSFQQSLFSCIQNRTENTRFVVDSSKTARNAYLRPLALKFFAKMDVKMIHLVRDGRACLVSNITGSNRKIEQDLKDTKIPFAAIRTALSWPIANIGAHIFQFFSSSENYCRIRYEDIFDEPDQTLHKIGDLLHLDLSQQAIFVTEPKPLPTGHQFSGNRLRSQPNLILQKNESWKGRLNIWQRIVFWIFNWPLFLFYGYHVK